ncbi:hypothetical protein [Desulfosudis oleivorans]|uniref:Patatin-like phospholipase family protein n=1 Tax=Desulfosudis oleivorans (strain DSM 6200 / JCM 39069 / Hxd3) TaxID=96561 RepID=A8ZSI3_DESOH|nr:hypothetical protein [Desulfosudis oleivorans]ABW67720.1 conserved hypothetical protein [Desulfosudis oleivorans Hxd3]
MNRPFVLMAGKKALARIRDEGLHPDAVSVVAGAAGGPKWLVLYGLDRLLFGRWFSGRSAPLHLIGSSIGSWRFTAASTVDPEAAFDRFVEAYINQQYSARPSPEEVTTESLRILDRFVDDDQVDHILSHPVFRLNCLSVRCRGALAGEQKLLQAPAMGLAALFNAAGRRTLRLFFERTLFCHPKGGDRFSGFNDFPTRTVVLRRDNLRQAVLASGSIPMVMSGVKNIAGSPAGTYRDGGLIDYHMNMPLGNHDGRIVLFPHYVNRVIPGWFDKPLAWRRPVAAHMENTLMVAPSPAFIKSLPMGKIPDRKDFMAFRGRDTERMACWRVTADRSRELADAFFESVASGRIRSDVTAF